MHDSCGCLLVCCVENSLLFIVTLSVESFKPLGRVWEGRSECLHSLQVSEILLVLLCCWMLLQWQHWQKTKTAKKRISLTNMHRLSKDVVAHDSACSESFSKLKAQRLRLNVTGYILYRTCSRKRPPGLMCVA